VLQHQGHAIEVVDQAEAVKHFRHHQDVRGGVPDAHLVVAPDQRPHRRHRLLRGTPPEPHHPRSDEPGMGRVGGAHVESIGEQVEPEWDRVEGDRGIAGGRDIRVAVAYACRQPRELEDDLVTPERRDARVEPAHRAIELLAGKGVEQVPVAFRHLGREKAQVRAPADDLRGCERWWAARGVLGQ
jgi:hypothetical protein